MQHFNYTGCNTIAQHYSIVFLGMLQQKIEMPLGEKQQPAKTTFCDLRLLSVSIGTCMAHWASVFNEQGLPSVVLVCISTYKNSFEINIVSYM